MWTARPLRRIRSKIPRKWDDSFSAFNGVVQQSGMDLTRYKGKTVEKWTALIPAASSGETSRYGVLLVYRKKAVGAYLLEKPSGTVIGLKDAQTAMAQAEQQDAQQVSGEDYSGDWGERHDEELGAAGQSQQTSGEPDSVVPEEAQIHRPAPGCRGVSCRMNPVEKWGQNFCSIAPKFLAKNQQYGMMKK